MHGCGQLFWLIDDILLTEQRYHVPMLSSNNMHQPGDGFINYHKVQVYDVRLFYAPQHRYLAGEHVLVLQLLRLQLLRQPNQLALRSQMQPDLHPVRARWLLRDLVQL